MNRSDRNRTTTLEAALRERDASVNRANLRALARLRCAGFSFTTIQQAEQHLAKIRGVARVQAEIAAELAAGTTNEIERKTA